MINRPEIILADEPTGNLDSKMGTEIMRRLTDLNRTGITVLMVTHDASCAAYAKRQVVFRDGRIASDTRGGTSVIASTASLAFSALLRNKMRSMLTMLGVIIGVGAVVLMQSMGRGATAYVGEAISGLGSNMLIVVPGTPHGMATMTQGVPLFTTADVDAIRRQAHDVGHVTAAGQSMRRVVVGSNTAA